MPIGGPDWTPIDTGGCYGYPRPTTGLAMSEPNLDKLVRDIP